MSRRVIAIAAVGGMFVAALAAGGVVGRLTAARPAEAKATRGGGSPLADELQLTTEQSAQMRPIWEAARDVARSSAKEAGEVQREHERRLAELLTPQQREEYARLSEENHRRIAELDARRKDAFARAVARTREILRPDQWTAYEQILKNQVGSVPAFDASTTMPAKGG